MKLPLEIGILGTGRMGSSIARRLHEKGFRLLLWNRDQAKAAALGFGNVLQSPAAVAEQADLVLSSLTDARAIRDVYLGPRGAIQGSHGQTFIDTSTAGREVIWEAAHELRARGSDLLDAPIAGAAPSVLEGNCLVLVSGDRRRTHLALPILEAIGAVRYVGALGTASLLKLVSNCMVAIQNAAAAELLWAAQMQSLDPEVVFDILERHAPGLGLRRKQYLSSTPQPVFFTVRDMAKDLDLAIEALTSRGKGLPVTLAAREQVGRALAAGADRDLSFLLHLTDHMKESSNEVDTP